MNFDTPENPTEAPEEEKIKNPAVLFRGKVYTGSAIHAFIYDEIQKDYPNESRDSLYTEAVDGFITNTEKFLNKDEAWQFAKKSGQLSHLEGSWEEERNPDLLRDDSDTVRELDSTDLEFADLLQERRQPSWKSIFDTWETLEEKSPDYTAMWQERGFTSWREWREAYIEPLGLEDEIWNVVILPNPTEALLEFYGAPTYSWQQKVYGGAQILPFTEIIQTPFVQTRKKIKLVQENFPSETMLIAIEYQGKKILIEGMHRACALATWPKDVPFTGTVRLAIASIAGRNPYPNGLPNIGNNYADKNL